MIQGSLRIVEAEAAYLKIGLVMHKGSVAYFQRLLLAGLKVVAVEMMPCVVADYYRRAIAALLMVGVAGMVIVVRRMEVDLGNSFLVAAPRLEVDSGDIVEHPDRKRQRPPKDLQFRLPVEASFPCELWSPGRGERRDYKPLVQKLLDPVVVEALRTEGPGMKLHLVSP